MTRRTPGFVVLYRWRVDPHCEAPFVAAWSRITELLVSEGSLGSRLHRASDGLWYAYAQWPSDEARQRAFALTLDPVASAQLRASIVESLPELVLDLVADYLE